MASSSPKQKLKSASEQHSSFGRFEQMSSKPDAGKPSILDAVRDQYGRQWISYGFHSRHLWVSLADLVPGSKSDVFQRLTEVDHALVEYSAHIELRKKVSQIETFRDALVASNPGWLAGSYITGSRLKISPPSEDREIIVTFASNPKFEVKGSLIAWQVSVSPLIKDQPLVLFSLAFALLGPMLTFFPAGYGTMIWELVGEGETGKSTLACLAASVWSGDMNSDCGGCLNWDFKLAALDGIKHAHCDNFLALDEGNLAGMSANDRRHFVKDVVFSLHKSGDRVRYGDSVISKHSKLAVMSTTNEALEEIIQGSSASRGAAQTRMLTMRVGANGIWNKVPAGFETTKAASEYLRDATNLNWGHAGGEYLRHLVNAAAKNEEALRNNIKKILDEVRAHPALNVGSARIQKLLAAVIVVGRYAEKWGIFLDDWDNIDDAVIAVATSNKKHETSPVAKPLDVIKSYIEKHRTQIVDVSALESPLSAEAFEECPGVFKKRDGVTELFVSPIRFRTAFQDSGALLKCLRDAKHARTEDGAKSTLSIKVPRSICASGRAYCIQID